jgi:cystathionine beta-synthase
MQVAEREGPGKRMVVLLPDHGNRYLSTFHGDEWMLERGFVEPSAVTVMDVLRRKSPGPSSLVSSAPADTVRAALERMRTQDVSQMPVLDGVTPVGSVEDGTILSRVLENAALLDSPISEVMGAPFPTVRPTEPMTAALEPLSQRRAAVLVMDNGDIRGILTRFDFLRFLG